MFGPSAPAWNLFVSNAKLFLRSCFSSWPPCLSHTDYKPLFDFLFCDKLIVKLVKFVQIWTENLETCSELFRERKSSNFTKKQVKQRTDQTKNRMQKSHSRTCVPKSERWDRVDGHQHKLFSDYDVHLLQRTFPCCKVSKVSKKK